MRNIANNVQHAVVIKYSIIIRIFIISPRHFLSEYTFEYSDMILCEAFENFLRLFCVKRGKRLFTSYYRLFTGRLVGKIKVYQGFNMTPVLHVCVCSRSTQVRRPEAGGFVHNISDKGYRVS